MLRMSKLTDYATVVMTYLARHSGRIHAANEIAAEVHLASPTVTKVLKMLAREGLLMSQRGTKGGYSLAREATRISIAEIIQAMEGPIGLTECGSSPGLCTQESSCSIRGNWQIINEAVLQALGTVSLAQLAVPPQPVRLNLSPPWHRPEPATVSNFCIGE
jgi:FeS assembly SUF system regulator